MRRCPRTSTRPRPPDRPDAAPASRGQPLAAGNARVKEARRLSRRPARAERRLFLADGPKAVEGALARRSTDGPGCAVEVFATAAATAAYAELRPRRRRPPACPGPWSTTGRSPASATASPRPASSPCAGSSTGPSRTCWPAGDLAVVAADVRDPGNAGTLIRTADAVGAAGVVLAGHSVDAYNPKTVRASVGSLFHLPVAVVARPGRGGRRRPVRRADGARGRRRRRGRPVRRRRAAAAAGRLAVRQRGVGPADRARRRRRPPGRGSRSPAAPRASTSRRPRRSASTPPPAPAAPTRVAACPRRPPPAASTARGGG